MTSGEPLERETREPVITGACMPKYAERWILPIGRTYISDVARQGYKDATAVTCLDFIMFTPRLNRLTRVI